MVNNSEWKTRIFFKIDIHSEDDTLHSKSGNFNSLRGNFYYEAVT